MVAVGDRIGDRVVISVFVATRRNAGYMQVKVRLRCDCGKVSESRHHKGIAQRCRSCANGHLLRCDCGKVGDCARCDGKPRRRRPHPLALLSGLGALPSVETDWWIRQSQKRAHWGYPKLAQAAPWTEAEKHADRVAEMREMSELAIDWCTR